MSASYAQATINSTQRLASSTVGNEVPTTSSHVQIEPFNTAARHAFYLMLDARKDESRERMTASEKQRAIRWLTEAIPERLDPMTAKKRSWIKSEFVFEDGKL